MTLKYFVKLIAMPKTFTDHSVEYGNIEGHKICLYIECHVTTCHFETFCYNNMYVFIVVPQMNYMISYKDI